MNPIKTTISAFTIAAAMVMAAGVGWSAEDAPSVDVPIYGPLKPTAPELRLEWGRRSESLSLGVSLWCVGTLATTTEKNTSTMKVVLWLVVDSRNVFVSGRDTTDWNVSVLPLTRSDGNTIFFAYKSGKDQSEEGPSAATRVLAHMNLA